MIVARTSTIVLGRIVEMVHVWMVTTRTLAPATHCGREQIANKELIAGKASTESIATSQAIAPPGQVGARA
jgi:hypothetical protein